MRTFPTLPSRRWMIAVLLAVMAPASLAAQPQAVAGTSVTLEPPAGFTPAERFTGFGREAALASIMVSELDAPFGQMVERLTPEAFAAQGMTVHTLDSLSLGGVPARLLSLTQEVDGVPFDKWVVMFGDDTVTTIVTAAYPSDSAASLGEPMRQAVLTARRGAPPSDPLAGLGFQLDLGRLRVAERMGNTLALNESGALPNEDVAEPLVVVGRSVAPADLSDLEAFSRRRVTRLGNLLEFTGISGGGPVTLAIGAGYELYADAVDTESGTAIRVYQVVIPDGDHYFLFQGLIGADRAHEVIPEYQALARTLRRMP
ncbi:MAG TPA: hypothetical protein VM759_07330 [Longimicrobium sp.]|nr:hypothetical protein [Longimicrobium sp.]